MASCKFEGGKCHGGAETSGYLRHNDITPENRKRVLEAKKKNDEECHIDPAKSHLNTSLTGYTYEQAFARYKDRIKELDEAPGAFNKRKDRVTMQAIEVPAPAGLPRDKYNQFFQRVADIMKDMYGERNLVDAVVHWDEEHEYIDSETHEKRVSRVHAHYDFIPEVNGKLNAKQFSCRANINRLNQEVEKMCVDEFDCHFHTGSKKRSKKTVQELKDESKYLQEQADKQAEKQAEIEKLQLQLDSIQQAIDAKQLELDNLPGVKDLEDELETRKTNLDTRETALTTRETDLTTQMQDFATEKEKWQETADKALASLNMKIKDINNAKLMYNNAYDDAKAMSEGISVDVFFSDFIDSLKQEMQKVSFKGGRTGWDVWGQYVTPAFERAKVSSKNTPAKQYQDRVEERIERADKIVNKAKKIPKSSSFMDLEKWLKDDEKGSQHDYIPG